MNPYKDLVSKITPNEFELFCFDILNAYAESEKLNDFKILHNKKVKSSDEIFQIDIIAEFKALNVKFKILIECKHQKRSVERDEVIILNDKIHNLASHKGILISTSGFQSGAIKRAEKNGIALIQIMDKNIRFIRASLPIKQDDRYNEFIKLHPPYFALLYSGELANFPDKQIYPTISMVNELKQKIINDFNN